MANHDKGRRKWNKNCQDNYNCRLDSENLMGGRRGPQPIYTPGSGPLKKTGRQGDSYHDDNLSNSSIQNRLKTSNQNTSNSRDDNNSKVSFNCDVNSLTNNLNDIHINHHREDDNQCNLSRGGNNIDSDLKKKNKKPEQQLYDPKKIQVSMAEREVVTESSQSWESVKDDDNDWDTQSNRSQKNDLPRNRSVRHNNSRMNNHSNENSNRNRDDPGKRYSGVRRSQSTNENEESWRSESPTPSLNFINRRDYPNRRNNRHGSEPPNNNTLPGKVNENNHHHQQQQHHHHHNHNHNHNQHHHHHHHQQHQRNRDTRSVEPVGNDKFPKKPPLGRRMNSKMGGIKIESLPPRLQKKYLAENGLEPTPPPPPPPSQPINQLPTNSSMINHHHHQHQHHSNHPTPPQPPLPPPSGVSNNVEESWKSKNTQESLNYQYPPPIIQQTHFMQNIPPYGSLPSAQTQWSNTLPPSRSRGRGRFRPEELDLSYRPGTPDQFSAPSSRSQTPSQEFVNRSYDRRGSNSTMCTSMESLSRADSVLMPPPPPPISPSVSHSNSHNKYSENHRRRPTSPSSSSSSTNKVYQSQRIEYNSSDNNSRKIDNDKKINNNQNTNRNSPKKDEECKSSSNESTEFWATPTADWYEDVESSERLETERLSRSSSVLSVHNAANVGENHGASGFNKNRSGRKKRRDRKRSDRSGSRDMERENSRERKNNQYNRENDNYYNNQKNNNRRFDNRRNKTIIHRSRESSKERGFRGRNESFCKARSEQISLDENWRTGKRLSASESEDSQNVSYLPCQTSPPSSSTAANSINSNCNPPRHISPVREKREISISANTPGVLILPERNAASSPPSFSRPQTERSTSSLLQQQQQQQQQQRKTLFDPNNPNKPIIVPSPGSRAALINDINNQHQSSSVHRGPSHFQQSLQQLDTLSASYIAEQMSSNSRPSWYDPCSDSLRSAKNPCLLMGIETMDRELQWLLSSGGLTTNWDRVSFLRYSLQQSLQNLLETDMKFCQAENVEQHFWKILFYNIIEMIRKIMPKEDQEGRDICKKIMLKIIDDGNNYFENLLTVLEKNYKFKIDIFLSSNSPSKGLGFVGLALISVQKIFLFLGDLARYKEQVNETTNYGKSRQWYLKAQQINPKNGRPYNQLALLAHYARRKLDAVYYYMRSLMASNPFHSARESLIALFDENRKKYESTERKRKEEREWKERARMKEKEGSNNCTGGLRREIWIHPGGRRMRRTTSTASASDSKLAHSDSEELAQLSSVDVNKRFVTSYLHVHGKLITKIGMETFQEAAIQMLREFRALLQHSPLPLPGTRLLQLLQLNMFAIETTQLKDVQMEQGYRSEVQERALVVSLQMFNLILERGVGLLKKQLDTQTHARLVVDEDMQVLLPAIKIWCDWMTCHNTVWNPPPSCTDYRVGSEWIICSDKRPPGDAWTRLATMVNLLEKLEYQRKMIIPAREANGRENEFDLIKLPEDTTLSGFTPLMSNPQDPFYAEKTDDMEVAQVCLRIQKILFFGQVFLCGLETPVLKLQKSETGESEYVSLVETSSNSSSNSPPEQSDSELLVDSYSEGENDDSTPKRLSNDWNAGSEIRSLIERKEELERRQRRQERHRQRVQAILQNSPVSVEIEVRPRQLVPDTNCFIDYLSQLQCITQATSGTLPLFTLMIPLVVLNELEGLARGATRDGPPASRASLNPEHITRVAESAKAALAFARSKNPAIRCLTTKGTVLTSSTFTVEEDVTLDGLVSNDDKILATCLSLCKISNKDQTVSEEGQPRRLRRDVVLLTEDRNLRVKALARDVPVREVPDFTQWAGLG